MSTDRLSRRIAIAAGGVALVAMSTLSACSTTKEKEKEAPSTTSTPSASTSPASPSPTEKAMIPGGPSFTPSINPMPPGAVCKEVINGVCMR